MIQSITVTLFVADMDTSVQFYERMLELPLIGRWGNHFAAFGFGAQMSITLHPLGTANRHRPTDSSAIEIGLSVAGTLEDAVSRLRDRGVDFPDPIVDDSQVRLAHFKDPDGHALYLSEVKN